MPIAADALADLFLAAARSRDLEHAVAAAAARAEGLAAETDWHARAADAFHEAVRAWSADLVQLRLLLDDLVDEVGAAAARERLRLELMPVGALP